MKSVILALIVATVVCMLIEFRHKLFGRGQAPGAPDEQTGSPAKWVVLGLVVLALGGVGGYLWFTSPEKPGNVSAPAPPEPPTFVEKMEQEALKEGVSLPTSREQSADSGQERTMDRDTVSAPGTQAADEPAVGQPPASEEQAPDEAGQADTPEEPPSDTTAAQSLSKPSPRQSEAREESRVAAAEPDDEPAAKPQAATAADQAKPASEPRTAQDGAAGTAAENTGDKPDAEYKYTILIGSYETRERAVEVAQWLQGKGDPGFTSFRTDPEQGKLYQVFIGSYKTLDEVNEKAAELRSRNFRQVDPTVRYWTVRLAECDSYNIVESLKAKLIKMGHVPFTIRCDSGYGKSTLLAGAYETKADAEKLLRELEAAGAFKALAVVLL